MIPTPAALARRSQCCVTRILRHAFRNKARVTLLHEIIGSRAVITPAHAVGFGGETVWRRATTCATMAGTSAAPTPMIRRAGDVPSG